MPTTNVAERLREREIAELRARIALGVKILTTAGYSMIGGTFFKDLTERHAVAPLSYLWTGAGIAFLAFAIFLAPIGKDADE